MSITQQSLLDAMDGIAMILDHELRIVRIGEPNWQNFAEDNAPQTSAALGCSKEAVLGHPVTRFIAGSAVRSTFADLFHGVLSGSRAAVRIDYRCDAPALRREMRLSATAINTKDEQPHLLYQSILLSAEQRPAVPLFGVPVADRGTDDILTLCAICARVAWPIDTPVGEREWIDAPEYYRRGGDEVSTISHGFCEDCFARLVAEEGLSSRGGPPPEIT